MKRLLWGVLILCCLVWIQPAARALAAAEGDFLPPQAEPMVTWTKDPLYDRYPVWHYTYGWGDSTFSDAVVRLYYLMNLMQVGKAWVVKLGVRSVEYALYFDPMTPLVGRVSGSLGRVLENGWLIQAGLALAGATGLWYWAVRGARGKAFRAVLGAGVVLIGSYVIVGVAPAFLVQATGTARGLGGEVMGAVAAVAAPAGSEGTPTERLLRSAGEGTWQALVLDPWLEGEFMAGAAEKPAYAEPDVPGGRWLAKSPQQRRSEFLNNTISYTARLQDFHQYNQDYVLDYMPRRFMLSLVSLLVGLAWAASMLLLAGGVIYNQLLLAGMLMLAPLWAVLALWHPAGLRIARGALVRAAGALVSQVVLMAVLAAALALTRPLLALSEPGGWLGQALLVTLLVGALCRYRFAWLRWGREASGPSVVREVATWRERIWQRRSSVRVERETAAPAAALPVFGAAAVEPLLKGEPPAAASGATVELADELRRLRLRFQASEHAAEVEAVRSELPRTGTESGRGGRGPGAGASGAPGTGAAGAGAAGAGAAGPRPERRPGEALAQYRKR